MAQRDRSQGFGFVYTDMASLIAQQESGRPHIPSNVKTINFNKDPRPSSANADQVPTPETRPEAIAQIRENLDRLQSLHHKLHAMLEELNTLTTDRKRREK